MQTSLQILTQKHRLTATVLFAASLLAGCAAPGAVSSSAPAAAVLTPAKAEDAVRVRAQQRWDWLVTGKYEDAYGYTTPAFRGLNTAQNYRNRFGTGASWTGARVQSVECTTPERCTVLARSLGLFSTTSTA